MTQPGWPSDLVEKARLLYSLHVPGEPVVLPNVWDASSARVFAEAGFPALATTSSAVSDALGFEDGERTPTFEMFAAIGRITNAVDIPVTADIERGYGLKPPALVEGLLEAGAVGCNLEDSDPATDEMVDAEQQAEWLGLIRAAADEAGVPIVINARVDVYLREWGSPGKRREEATRRARAYVDAGASSVYPFGLTEAAELRSFVDDVGAPVNVIFLPDGPSMDELAQSGAARITFGGGLHQLTHARLTSTATRILERKDPYSR